MVEYETDNNVFAAKAQIATALSTQSRSSKRNKISRVCLG